MNNARTIRRARAALACALAGFVGVQLALNVALEGPGAALYDTEFGEKLDRLRKRREEAREGPLVLLLGSSRSAGGVLPSLLAAVATPDGRKPVVFNFAMTGHGPIQELMLLRRLLRRGIRPDDVLIEVHPALLHQESGGYSEETWIQVDRLERGDLSTLRRYVGSHSRWTQNWWRLRLVPSYSRHLAIINHFAPRWVKPSALQVRFCQIDAHGWLSSPFPPPTAEDRLRWTENARHSYAPAFERFRVSALADLAIRELLDLCRDEGIAAALFLMPEGSDFRAWYPPTAHAEIMAYLAGLCDQYDVGLFDATTWCDDTDFADGHHLLCEPAGRFSERFGRDVLRPWLAGATTRSELVRRPPAPQPNAAEAHR